MGNLAVIHDEHRHRLETKLKRELGDRVLALLNDDRAEEVILNPDSSLVEEDWGGVRVRGRDSSGASADCDRYDRRPTRRRC